MVVVIFLRHLEMWHQDNSGLNNNSGIQFAGQENIIIDSNIIQIQPQCQNETTSGFLDAILNFWVKESSVKVGMGTAKRLTVKNMGIAFDILSLGDTEPDTPWGHLPPPHNCNVRFKKYHCNTRVKKFCQECRLRWISVVYSYDDTLMLKLHQFDFVVNLLQECSYNMSSTDRPSGVWCSLHIACCLVITVGVQRDMDDFA